MTFSSGGGCGHFFVVTWPNRPWRFPRSSFIEGGHFHVHVGRGGWMTSVIQITLQNCLFEFVLRPLHAFPERSVEFRLQSRGREDPAGRSLRSGGHYYVICRGRVLTVHHRTEPHPRGGRFGGQFLCIGEGILCNKRKETVRIRI